MKVALITGASSGIGAAAARHLSLAGYRVILTARGQRKLEEVAREIGSSASIEVCDVSQGSEVESLAARVRESVGVPDLIVNSAGVGQWKYLEKTSLEEARTMINAPYLAAVNVTQVFLNEMLERRSGVVIHVNSGAALFAWPSAAGYTAARWALRGLNEALNQDLQGTGVKSCNLVLGRVDSPYFDNNPDSEEALPGIARTIRTLSPDECGRIIARLAERPRREAVYPLMLRVYGWTNRFLPSVVRGLLRRTGAKRSRS